jgi:hypothetical protein
MSDRRRGKQHVRLQPADFELIAAIKKGSLRHYTDRALVLELLQQRAAVMGIRGAGIPQPAHSRPTRRRVATTRGPRRSPGTAAAGPVAVASEA